MSLHACYAEFLSLHAMEKLIVDMQLVLHQFLAMVPVRHIQWPEGFSYTSEEQKQLITKVVSHSLCKQYPPSTKYQMHFLKHIMTQADNHGHSLVDEVYELYATLVAVPQSEMEECCFKSYHLGVHGYVTLKESTHLISQGTTGLTTWQAAFYFVEWALENVHLFQQKHILELGAGIGFAGVALCYMCQPKAYHFTDCHAEVLQRLRENVEINLEGTASTLVKVSKLDWSKDIEEYLFTQTRVDSIIAIDVVYDTEITCAFVRAIRQLLRNSTADVYVASTIRNVETYKHFCSQLDAVGIMKTTMESNTTKLFHYDRTQAIEIFRLQNNIAAR